MGKYDVEKKVESYMDKHQMLPESGGILAGVSGGADSVCMLLILDQICGRKKIPLHVIHINHGVREDAGKDAAFVKELCDSLRRPFYLEEVDMEGYARQQGLSEEEAGRVLRYRLFERCLDEQKLRCVAVAHNKDDRAETMLFHLCRGTGIKGLASILPVREEVIRPILCLDREEIEAYLKECGVGYCRDSTNDSDAYTRNRIRHHILPFVKQEICAQAVARMNETAEQLSEIQGYLERQAEKGFAQCVKEAGSGLAIDIPSFHELDAVIEKQVLLKCFEQLTPRRKDITSVHIEAVLQLMQVAGSTAGQLPYGLEAVKEYDRLMIRKREVAADPAGGSYLLFQKNETDKKEGWPVELRIPDLGKVSCEIISDFDTVRRMCQNIEQNQYTKWFDYDKITTSVWVRTRQAGDYFICDGAGHKKSLKEYMINEKIPRNKRDSLWLIAEDHMIIWVPGYRISESHKIDENTKRILKICIQEEDNVRTC